VGGLEGSKKEEGNEGVGQAPADLHPPLIADKGALGPFDKLRDRLNKRFKWRSCSGASPSQLLCL